MNKQIHIRDLVIEVTRRCNMSCSHCLRGKQENIDMDLSYIETLFSKVQMIGTIILTGGEPSLVPSIVAKILNLAKKYGVEINSFYMTTNATRITNKFITILMNWVDYCGTFEEYNKNENGPCVEWSNDQFHDRKKQEKGIKLLKMLSFTGPKTHRIVDTSHLIKQGRAIDNHNAQELPEEYFELEEYSTYVYVESCLYLNCHGVVICGCNWSYQSQDNPAFHCRICHVDDLSVKIL